MTTPSQPHAALRMAAIPQPTPDDVRHFEEFLRQRHPMLLAAIARVAEKLVRDGVDLEQLLASDDSTHTEDAPE
jgi:hypothetical protein